MSKSSVVQLHRTLVDAICRTRPGATRRPVTVAEIYQDLVPYRTARAIGFELNADYEYALLRLLAGEGNLARIEPGEVREKLRMELESANPDIGLFRNYAACDVWVNVGDAEAVVEEEELDPALDQVASWEEEFLGPAAANEITISSAPPPDFVAASVEETVGGLAADSTPESEAIRPRFEIAATTPEPMAEATPELEAEQVAAACSCVFCGGELPEGRIVNFCPFCGSDQSQQPCPACGELVEPLWRFCVSCGTRVRPLGDHVN